MLTAKQANRIANSELLQIMNIIRKSAYDGGLKVTLDYHLKDTTVKVLKDLGYSVELKELASYPETPYGILSSIPLAYTKKTIINWNENTNNS